MVLHGGTEPSHTRLIAYQQEAANCLACLQRRAYANSRAATFVHQWLYELQLPYLIGPGFGTPVILAPDVLAGTARVLLEDISPPTEKSPFQ